MRRATFSNARARSNRTGSHATGVMLRWEDRPRANRRAPPELCSGEPSRSVRAIREVVERARKMTRRLLISAFGPFGLLAIHAAACRDTSHVFEGRLLAQQKKCLGTTSSLDVVEGDSVSQCPPACLAQPLSDGGRAIYVATMCAPSPFAFDASGTDLLCPSALDALERNDTCLLDGGSANPLPPPADAGGD